MYRLKSMAAGSDDGKRPRCWRRGDDGRAPSGVGVRRVARGFAVSSLVSGLRGVRLRGVKPGFWFSPFGTLNLIRGFAVSSLVSGFPHLGLLTSGASRCHRGFAVSHVRGFAVSGASRCQAWFLVSGASRCQGWFLVFPIWGFAVSSLVSGFPHLGLLTLALGLRGVKPGFWFSPFGTLNLGTLCIGRRREQACRFCSHSLQHLVHRGFAVSSLVSGFPHWDS